MQIPHISRGLILVAVPFVWNFFWNAIYSFAPPREWFNSPKYNKFLDVVSYYGALNIRGILMRLLYGAQPSAAPPSPKQQDDPPVTSH